MRIAIDPKYIINVQSHGQAKTVLKKLVKAFDIGDSTSALIYKVIDAENKSLWQLQFDPKQKMLSRVNIIDAEESRDQGVIYFTSHHIIANYLNDNYHQRFKSHKLLKDEIIEVEKKWKVVHDRVQIEDHDYMDKSFDTVVLTEYIAFLESVFNINELCNYFSKNYMGYDGYGVTYCYFSIKPGHIDFLLKRALAPPSLKELSILRLNRVLDICALRTASGQLLIDLIAENVKTDLASWHDLSETKKQGYCLNLLFRTDDLAYDERLLFSRYPSIKHQIVAEVEKRLSGNSYCLIM